MKYEKPESLIKAATGERRVVAQRSERLQGQVRP